MIIHIMTYIMYLVVKVPDDRNLTRGIPTDRPDADER